MNRTRKRDPFFDIDKNAYGVCLFCSLCIIIVILFIAFLVDQSKKNKELRVRATEMLEEVYEKRDQEETKKIVDGMKDSNYRLMSAKNADKLDVNSD